MKKKVENKGIVSKITKAEKEVLHLLTKEFLTVKQIAIRRKTSDKAVYKIISKIKKKGILTGLNKRGDTIQPKPQECRLHGQQFHINILYKDHRYKSHIKKTNMIELDGNTIMMYPNSVEIYSNTSFYADDEHKATFKSLLYWNRIFRKLENQLSIILIKSRKQNIKLVQQHYAETNNEIAKDCNNQADKIRIYAQEDGKLCFMIDNSFNLNEAETTHPTTAKRDYTQFKKQINDWRINNPPTLSEIMHLVNEMAETNKETAAGLNTVVNLLKPNNNITPTETIKRKPKYIG